MECKYCNIETHAACPSHVSCEDEKNRRVGSGTCEYCGIRAAPGDGLPCGPCGNGGSPHYYNYPPSGA